MSNQQQRCDNDQAAARPTEPTLAEFREYLIDAAGPTPGVVQEGILQAVVNLVDRYTADHPGAPVPGGDTLSRKNLVSVVNVYRNTQRRGTDGDLDGLLDDYAAEFNLADIRILRLAAEVAVAITPRAIKAARDRGMRSPQIADELGLTSSRIYQVLREQAADGDQ